MDIEKFKEKVKTLLYVDRSNATKQTGISYLGGIDISSKITKSQKFGAYTYIIYLSPYKSSGYNVCAGATNECIEACLNQSGRVRIERDNRIKTSRKKRTWLFYSNRDFFMQWMIDEIRNYKIKADIAGFDFAVRINGTSDLSLEIFKYKGKNILEIFPDVDFYDYTKINNRLKLMDKYSNYHLTLSYTGYNWTECIEALENGINVAAVFDTKKGQDLPIGYEGYEVVDGDLSDYRLTDPKGVIVGLRFKKVINDIDLENNPFIVSTKETKLIAA